MQAEVSEHNPSIVYEVGVRYPKAFTRKGFYWHETLEEAVDLQLAYLRAGILGESLMVDALHVGMATVLEWSVIVSWNFKHIVHF